METTRYQTFFFLRLTIRNYQRIFAILDKKKKRISLMGLLHASLQVSK